MTIVSCQLISIKRPLPSIISKLSFVCPPHCFWRGHTTSHQTSPFKQTCPKNWIKITRIPTHPPSLTCPPISTTVFGFHLLIGRTREQGVAEIRRLAYTWCTVIPNVSLTHIWFLPAVYSSRKRPNQTVHCSNVCYVTGTHDIWRNHGGVSGNQLSDLIFTSVDTRRSRLLLTTSCYTRSSACSRLYMC